MGFACWLRVLTLNVPRGSHPLRDGVCVCIQVERKRHIGNDIVTIVFQEGEEPSPAFKPSMIRSHFTRILGLCGRSSLAAAGRHLWALSDPQTKRYSDRRGGIGLRCGILRPAVLSFSLNIGLCPSSLSIHGRGGWTHSQRIPDLRTVSPFLR